MPAEAREGTAPAPKQLTQKADGRLLSPVSEAGEAAADDTDRGKRKRPPNWRGKPEVLEQVNELISELDGIAGSIANQVPSPSPLSSICGATQSYHGQAHQLYTRV